MDERPAWVGVDKSKQPMAHVLLSHSLNEKALDSHLELYRTIMFGSSGLSRREREMTAVAVSVENECHY